MPANRHGSHQSLLALAVILRSIAPIELRENVEPELKSLLPHLATRAILARMRTGVKRFRVGALLRLLSVLTCALPTVSSGDPGLKFEGERWIPALALISSVSTHSSTVSSAASASDADFLSVGIDRRDGAALEEPLLPAVLVIHPAGSSASEGQGVGGTSDSPKDHNAVAAATGRDQALDGSGAFPETRVVGRAQLGLLGMVSSTDLEVQDDASAAVPRDETERWVPAFAIYSGALVQTFDGALESSPVFDLLNLSSGLNCGNRNAFGGVLLENLLACPASGDGRFVDPFVGGSLELMTPGLTSLPGRPRFFVRGGAAADFGFERSIAKTGNLSDFEDSTGASERAIEGQGAVTSAQVEPLLIQAGAGVAFTVDVGDRRFRIKPSVEYLREEIHVSGELQRAVCFAIGPSPGTCGAQSIDDFRLIEFGDDDKRYYHGLGPGLEIEADAARAGPFMMTVFIAGKAYYFMGDRTVHLEDSQDFFGGVVSESASWDFERKRWAYEGGVGVRFRWLPE